MTPSCFIHVLTTVRTHHLHTHIMCICVWYMQIILFQISFCITRSTNMFVSKEKRNMFFFRLHESQFPPICLSGSLVCRTISSGSNRWIVFTEVRALSCGQWVSQLHGHFEFFSAGKLRMFFRNSKKLSQVTQVVFSRNSLKYLLCLCFCCPEIWRTPETGASFCFFGRIFARQVNFNTPRKNTWYVWWCLDAGIQDIWRDPILFHLQFFDPICSRLKKHSKVGWGLKENCLDWKIHIFLRMPLVFGMWPPWKATSLPLKIWWQTETNFSFSFWGAWPFQGLAVRFRDL